MTDDRFAAADDEQSSGVPDEYKPRDLISRILGWLRAGYPAGVPQQDYVALLGILERSLTSTELDRVVEQLSQEADAGQVIITPADVRQEIQEVVKGPPTEADITRVSARLAAAGWPLWSGPDDVVGEHAIIDEPVRPGLVAQFVGWLREGYPAEMSAQDYIPLVALLRRRLTDAEVALVSRKLVEAGTLPPDRADVGTGIARVTSELPSEKDIARVRNYLTDHGWPADYCL